MANDRYTGEEMRDAGAAREAGVRLDLLSEQVSSAAFQLSEVDAGASLVGALEDLSVYIARISAAVRDWNSLD